MVKQIKEFLSLIFTGNINTKIDDNGHLIFIDDIYTPFESKTYTDNDYEIIEEGTIKLDRNNSSIEIVYSYVKDFDYEKLQAVKQQCAEDIKKYNEIPKDLAFPTIFDIATIIGYKSDHDFAESKLKRIQEIEKNLPTKQYPYGFIGTFVSNDLALVYRDKTITGGVYLPDGNTAFISAKIDEYGNIGMLDINVFDNVFDMAMFATYEDDGIGALISYSEIDKQIEALKDEGINPSLSMQIDFNQILKEGHHSDLKNYMTLIHIFKDIIIGKIQDAMQSEKVKTKNSGN